MRLSLLKFIILTNFRIAVSLILHARGPTHKKIVDDCLEEIVKKHFHFQRGKSYVNHTMLLTVLVTNNLTSPAFEIQENIIRKTHDLAEWYQIEVVSSGERHEFQSFAKCTKGNCLKSFIIDFKSNFYVIVVDNEDNLDIILEVLEESKTFNPKGLYLVYLEYNGPEYRSVAKNILLKMWNKLLVNTALLIPKTLQILNLYKMNSATRGPYPCESNVTLDQIDQCVKGNMLNIQKHYYEEDEDRNFLNCSVGVITTQQKPFVINKTKGFEIKLLESIAKLINVHFNITVDRNLTDTWGQEENDSWTGRLKFVYENYSLGIGNVETGMSYATDFSFSRYYHMEPLVMVVPIARFVPKWRVLIAIFTVEMWGVCLAIVVSFAVSFYVASKFGGEVQNFKKLGDCLFQSFQIIVYHAVPTHPITDVTRVFFVSLAMISIIMCSAYTCSLVYYLKNPIREHQAKDMSDIMDDFGGYKYGIGGVRRFRELFTSSNDDEGTQLFEMYQTAPGDNNTLLYWIRKVADERSIWTVSSKLYVDYLLTKSSNATTDDQGKPKIYVFKKKLVAYSISIIMRKGHPLLRNIDYAIQRLTWAGLITHMADKYRIAYQRQSMMADNVDDTYAPLDIEDLQGAFVLLAAGCCLGFVVLVMECFVQKYKDEKSVKVGGKRAKQMGRVDRRVRNRL